MKKFLIFILIAISVVSFGLTIYYFSADNEVIYINSSYLVIDVGEIVPTGNLVAYKNKNENTTLTYDVSQSGNVLSYSSNEEYFTAISGGESKIVVTTNNRNYSKLIINVLVCDGSENYPYIISNETELKLIGVSDKYLTSMNYKLGSDIIFTENIVGNWTPISNFSGTFDGDYFTISNILITDTTIGTLTEVGFFSSLTSTGIVKNLILDNITINANATYMGSVVGKSEGKIQTSIATGQLSNKATTTSSIGGIVGFLNYNTSKPIVDRCGFEGGIETVNTSTTLQTNGGVVGYNFKGRITESYYRATSEGYVKNNQSNFGGIVGKNEGDNEVVAELYDCYFYMGFKSNGTNEPKIGGIIYSNINSSNENIILGNYFSGQTALSQQSQIVVSSPSSVIDTRTNCFLSATEFAVSSNFVTAIYTSAGYSRYWDFDTVWSMGGKYPIINTYSSVGSTYLIDVREVLTASDIVTAQEFYDAISGNTIVDNNTFRVIGTLTSGKYEINFSSFVWGDSTHPIPNIFSGTIVCENECVLKNLTITNSSVANNVGLVKELSKQATISGLSFDNIRIIGTNGRKVGVLAGVNKGANISEITINNVSVEIGGDCFGTLFGASENGDISHGIKSVSVQNVDATAKYFVIAGGLVGKNYSNITATQANYSVVRNIKLFASYLGGVVGFNAGRIEFVSASGIYFNKEHNSQTILDIYSGETRTDGLLDTSSLFIGGIAGLNTASIYNVYASSNFTAESGSGYRIYMGGVAGEATSLNGSSSIISRAYVYSTSLKVTSSHSSRVGGVAGYHKGTISNCVVDNDCVIDTIISNSKSTSTSGNVSNLSIDECSVVGGLVGYEANNTNSSASIYESISNAKTIKGFYAGGLAGISYGKISRSSVGLRDEVNGKVELQGFLVGGLSALISNGYIKDCYAICKLTTSNYEGSFKDVTSVIKLDVSSAGGLVVLAINSSVLQGNYCVITFLGNGVSFATCADTSNYTNPSTIIGNVYQTEGSIKTNFGTKLTEADLKGNGGKGFKNFQANVGSENFGSTWTTQEGKYPKIEKLEESCPNITGII
ncbi:MAG: hypothetical protein EOM55_01905 [Clostridia bacterium]|nr:hypothetical protein [Clostridia bacterium]